MLAVPMSFGLLFIQPMNSLAIWLGGKLLEETREITFEIGMLGHYGLGINDPKETHVLRSLPGRKFSALELGCIKYAGFKRIESGMGIGVELGEEWGIAESLGTERRKASNMDAQELPGECQTLQKAANGLQAQVRQFTWGAPGRWMRRLTGRAPEDVFSRLD